MRVQRITPRGLAPLVAVAALLAGCGAARPGVMLHEVASSTRTVRLRLEAPADVRREGGARLAKFLRGRALVVSTGCLACHRIGYHGRLGPGPNLTEVGGRLPRRAIEVTLLRGRGMRSYRSLGKERIEAIAEFLSLLRESR